MIEDFSFIRFYKNDFLSAYNNERPSIATINKEVFLLVPTNKTIFQKSNTNFNFTLVGSIKVELIDCCQEIIQDVTSNFYYQGYVNAKGINQIDFEFGNVGIDYYRKPLYLKITDLVNGNLFYSNGFNITNYEIGKASCFDYYANGYFRGASYDILPFKQRIFFTNFYYNDDENSLEFNKYVDGGGFEVAYRHLTTYLKSYIFDKLDLATSNRLYELFSHDFIYLNEQRATISSYKTEKREGQTNFKSASISVNFKNEKFKFAYQLYQELKVITLNLPSGSQSTLTSIIDLFTITFNKPITNINNSVAKLFLNGIEVFSALITSIGTISTIDFTNYTWLNGNYYITIDNGLINSSNELFNGFISGEWNFKIISGEFDSTEFDNNEFLTI